MEHNTITSYISHYTGASKGWAACATMEDAERHQALFEPERRSGIKPSSEIKPGVAWIEGQGYYTPGVGWTPSDGGIRPMPLRLP
jgi:hypothetical protein